MSTSIEQRVVQMRFDNKQFEAGVAQTMSTLDKFKSKLNFKGASKSFDELTKAADQVSLASIMDQTEEVGTKFDAMAVVAITALQRMTNAAITLGTNMVKSLSVDQITAGWTKYEQKTGSVQTIMNATGKSIDEVNGYLDKLMWFSDETSYGFTDMTAALGQLTSAGGDIDKLVPMIMGIANATAFAGKGVNEFSRSIYNLNQSYSAGYLQYMDWKSLELAGVASKQLKEVFIGTAEELGKVNKGAITLANFGETLKNKWADTEVMEKAFGRFGEMTEKAYEMVQSGMVETASEAYEILSQTYTGFGITAAKAAQEAKSFAEAVDATKDAVSSGWMKTFEIIFGNYEEAKKLWTDLANTMWDIFASGANDRNEMLTIWKNLGGRVNAIKAITYAFEGLSKILGAVKQGFDEIFFPGTNYDKAWWLHVAVEHVKDFMRSLIISDEAANTLRVTIKALLLPVQVFVQTIRIGIAAIAAAVRIIFKLGDALLALPSLIGGVNDPLRKLFGDDRYERIASALSTIVSKLGEGFKVLAEKAKDVLSSFKSVFNINLPSSFRSLVEAAKPLANWILDRIVDGFEALAKFDYSLIGTGLAMALDMAAKGLTYLIDLLKTGKNFVVDFLSQFKLMSPLDILKAIANSIYKLGMNVVDFFKNLDLSRLIEMLSERFGVFGEVLGRLGQAVVDFVARLTPAKVLVFSFGATIVMVLLNLSQAIAAFKAVAKGFVGVVEGIGNVLNAVANRIKGNRFLQIATAITILAGALILLSQVNPEGLKQATMSLGILITLFTAMIAAVALIERFVLTTPAMINGLKEIGVAMLAMAGSVAVLSGALLILSNVKLENIFGQLVALGVVMLEMVAAMRLIRKAGNAGVQDAIYIVAFALAIKMMVDSLNVISGANLSNAIGNLGAMIVIIGLLSVISRASKGVKFTSGLGMLLIVGSLLIFADALKKLGKVDTAALYKSLVNFIPIFAVIAAISFGVVDGGEAVKAGLGLMAMAGGILVLYQALKMLGSMDPEVLERGTWAVGSLMVTFGLMSALAKIGGNGSSKITGSFVGMAAAIVILGVAIDYIGGLELKKVVQGTVVVGALLLFLTFLGAAIGTTQKATGSVVAMTFCIGLLIAAIALLTLLDPVELGTSVAAISVALLALGGMFKLMGNVNVKSAASSLLVIIPVLISLGVAFGLMQAMDPDKMLKTAESLSLVVVALGAMIKLMQQDLIGQKLDVKSTLITMAASIAAAGVVLAALDRFVVNDKIVEKAAALSLVMVSLGAVTALISKLNIGVKGSASGAFGIMAVATILIAFLTGLGAILSIKIGDYDLEGFLNKGVTVLNSLWKVVPAIAALAAVTKAMEFLGMGGLLGIGYASAGAIALDVVAAIIISFVGFIGKLYSENPKWQDYLEQSVEVFGTLGRVFGALVRGFAGEAIGGTLSAISAVLPDVAQNFSDFGENIQGFLTSIENVDPGKVGAITSLADMMLALTSANLLQQVLPFIDDNPLATFADQLTDIAPDLVEFSDGINNINEAKVTAVAAVMGSFAEVMSQIPTEGGLMGAIFGNKNMDSFGSGMKAFAEGFSEYASVIDSSDLSQDSVDKTKYAADALIELAEKIPASGGALQSFFGEQDLGKFGRQLKKFAEGLMEFFSIISGKSGEFAGTEIDFDMVTRCGNASQALAEFASAIPRAGGTLQTFFGEQNIGLFGSQLETFARHLVKFFQIMSGQDSEAGVITFDQNVVDMAVYAGKALNGLAKEISPVGGMWQQFVGRVDLGSFGDDISYFGEGMRDFFNYFKSAKVTEDDVESARNAGSAFTELVNNLNPNTGWKTMWENVDLGEYGESLKKFGEGMRDYYSEIKDISFSTVEKSTQLISDLIGLSDGLLGLSTYSATNFNTYLAALARNSLEAFGEAFRNGDSDLQEAIGDTIKAAFDGVGDTIEANGLDYTFVIDAMINSIAGNVDKIQNEAASIATLFCEYLKGQNDQFIAVGAFIIAGLNSGMGSTTSMTSLGVQVLAVSNKILSTLNGHLEINAGYSGKFDSIGRYCIKGFIRGFEAEAVGIQSNVTRVGNNVVTAFENATGVASPSVKFREIGMYTMLGFKLGVEEQIPILNRTMVKMGGSLLTTIKDFFGIHSPSTVTRDEVGRYIVDGIAEGITQNMSAEEAASKKAQNIVSVFRTEFDKLDSVLSTANLEYELWQAMNPNATGGVATAKQIEVLDKQLEVQANRVNLANAQYQATLQALGENADETRDAYNTYLQEKIDLADLAQQMTQIQNSNGVAFREYDKLMRDNYDDLIEYGMTADQIRDWAKMESGWIDPKDQPDFKKMAGSIEEIMNAYTTAANDGAEEVDVIVKDGVAQTFASTAAVARQSGSSSMTSMAQGISENSEVVTETVNNSIWKPIKEVAEENGYGSAISTVEGFIDGLRSDSVKASDAAVEFLGEKTSAALDFFNLSHSPSRLYYEKGMYVVQGFAMGIEETSPQAVASITEMANATISVMSDQPQQYTQIGGQICAGLASGIRSGTSSVVAAAASMAQQALMSTRAVLDINSPSREYYDIGRMMDQGLANGIIDNASLVTKAVGNMLGKAENMANSHTLSPVRTSSTGGGWWGKDGVWYTRGNERVEQFTQLLQWDAGGNLIPVGMSHSGNTEGSTWWIAPTKEIAESIRYMGDTVAEQQARAEANQGLYEGSVRELRDAISSLASKPSGVNFTQNNYSPESLSAGKIYTNTQTALARTSAAVSPTDQSLKTTGTGIVGSGGGGARKVVSTGSAYVGSGSGSAMV